MTDEFDQFSARVHAIERKYAFMMRRIRNQSGITFILLAAGLAAFVIAIYTVPSPWVLGVWLAYLAAVQLRTIGRRKRDERAWEKHDTARTDPT